jgi:excisionase family DNA binding protein
VPRTSKQPRKSEPSPNLIHDNSVVPRLLRLKQAAEYLGCTLWYIRTLIWSRRIPFLTLGKRHLIDRADLDKFVDAAREVAS